MHSGGRVTKGASEFRERILQGPIVRTLLWLAWPVIVANLVQISYNLVDAFWLGKLGRQAFGAPTVSWPLISLFYSIGMGFASAGMTIVSQYFGAGERELADRSAGQLVAFLALMALSISVVGFATAPLVLEAMGVPPDVYPLAVGYIRVIFAGIPVAFMGFAFIMLMNSIGDTRTPMKLSVASALLNMVLDPIMIFGLLGLPPMGVVGAAIATMTARGVVAAVGTYLLIKGYRGIKLRLEYLRIERWWLRKVLSIGVPISIQSSANSLGFVVMMSIVSRFGSATIAAYGVGIRIVDVLQAFTWGINRATSIMVGQNIGAELYDRARRVARSSMALLTAALSLGAVVVYLFRGPVVAVFVSDPLVIAEGSRFLSYFAPSIPFFGLFFIGGGIAQGSGHTKAFAAITIARLWGLRIGLSALLAIAMGMGATGIWIAMSLSNIGGGLMSLAWVSRGTWLQRVVEVPARARAHHNITARTGRSPLRRAGDGAGYGEGGEGARDEGPAG